MTIFIILVATVIGLYVLWHAIDLIRFLRHDARRHVLGPVTTADRQGE